MLDAKAASQQARDYFIAVHGALGVWGFQVEEAAPSQDKRSWQIRCSFSPTMNDLPRYSYELSIDAEDGTVEKVKRLQAQPGR